MDYKTAGVDEARKDALTALTQASKNNESNQIAPAWMIVKYGTKTGDVLLNVPMPDIETCELQGAIWTTSKKIYRSSKKGFVCIEGE